jgi:predicted nucleic acid-binding protein
MVLLDAEGLSGLVRRDPAVFALVKGLAQTGETVAVSAATLVEGVSPSWAPPAVRWAVSGLDVVDVTRAVALMATDLLRTARRHGHRDAMDAIVCATALQAGEPTTILTSDPTDINDLVDDHAAVTVLAL